MSCVRPEPPSLRLTSEVDAFVARLLADPGADGWTVRIVPAAPAATEMLVREVLEQARNKGFSGPALFELEVVLEEAFSNAYRHGCQGRDEESLIVFFRWPEPCLELGIRDPGPGFSVPPASSSDQAVANPFAASGRGRPLLLRLTDDLTYNSTGSTIIIRKRNSAKT